MNSTSSLSQLVRGRLKTPYLRSIGIIFLHRLRVAQRLSQNHTDSTLNLLRVEKYERLSNKAPGYDKVRMSTVKEALPCMHVFFLFL